MGPITCDTTESILQETFGRENVVPQDIEVGEGAREPGTVVYPDVPTQRLEVIWQGDGRNTPASARVRGASSRWLTESGVTVGSSLQQIERVNRYPFRLMGFAWDYGGTTVSCDNGRFRSLGGCGEPRTLLLRLRPTPQATALPSYRQVIGERVFSSGHPAMQQLAPLVYEMTVTFESCSDRDKTR